MIEIYTDGSCRKTKEGGIGVVLLSTHKILEISKSFRDTTNNKMELMAVIEALHVVHIKEIPIKLYSDSGYVCNAINKNWITTWMNNGWINRNNKSIANIDLWKVFMNEYEKFSNIQVIHIKGHKGICYNERADKLATNASAFAKLDNDVAEHIITYRTQKGFEREIEWLLKDHNTHTYTLKHIPTGIEYNHTFTKNVTQSEILYDFAKALENISLEDNGIVYTYHVLF